VIEGALRGGAEKAGLFTLFSLRGDWREPPNGGSRSRDYSLADGWL